MAATNVFETKLAKRMQVTRYSTPVFAAQASFEERSGLSDGEAVVRPTFGRLYADSYTRGSDLPEQNHSESSETLTVNQSPAILIPVDSLDELQHKTALQERVSKDGMRAINKHIDALYLAEAANASSTVDAGDTGGSSGSPISLDSTKVLQIFPAAQRKLQLKDVDIVGAKDPRPQTGNMKPMGGAGFANLSPYVNEQLTYALASRATTDGDLVGKNGYKSTYFDFDVFVTTNGLWQGVLGLATNPTANDTVVINGVTFTFVSSIGSTAGNVLIGASVDATRANLEGAINSPGTTSSTQVAVSSSDQNKLRRISASNDDSADTLTVTAKGYGHVVVSETLTAGGDSWTSEVSKQLLGEKGCVDMVLQKEVGVKISDIPKRLGAYVKPYALFGIKTFTEGADAAAVVDIDSSSWV